METCQNCIYCYSYTKKSALCMITGFFVSLDFATNCGYYEEEHLSEVLKNE